MQSFGNYFFVVMMTKFDIGKLKCILLINLLLCSYLQEPYICFLIYEPLFLSIP